MPTPQEVLHFWFEETPPSAWFRPGPDRDRIVRERFGALTDQALAGQRAAWGDSAADALALLLVLDQFPRQIWRDQARAFAGDGQALALTLRAVEAGWVEAEPAPEPIVLLRSTAGQTTETSTKRACSFGQSSRSTAASFRGLIFLYSWAMWPSKPWASRPLVLAEAVPTYGSLKKIFTGVPKPRCSVTSATPATVTSRIRSEPFKWV
jgi:hypothetical protein